MFKVCAALMAQLINDDKNGNANINTLAVSAMLLLIRYSHISSRFVHTKNH